MARLGTHGRAISSLLRVCFTGLLPHNIQVEVRQPLACCTDAASPLCGIKVFPMDILCLLCAKKDVSSFCLLWVSTLPPNSHLGGLKALPCARILGSAAIAPSESLRLHSARPRPQVPSCTVCSFRDLRQRAWSCDAPPCQFRARPSYVLHQSAIALEDIQTCSGPMQYLST